MLDCYSKFTKSCFFLLLGWTLESLINNLILEINLASWSRFIRSFFLAWFRRIYNCLEIVHYMSRQKRSELFFKAPFIFFFSRLLCGWVLMSKEEQGRTRLFTLVLEIRHSRQQMGFRRTEFNPRTEKIMMRCNLLQAGANSILREQRITIVDGSEFLHRPYLVLHIQFPFFNLLWNIKWSWRLFSLNRNSFQLFKLIFFRSGTVFLICFCFAYFR